MSIEIYILAGVISLVGVIGFLLLSRKHKKNKAIAHYEQIRDKLTVREQKQEEEKIEESYSGLGTILINLLAAIVTVSLIAFVAVTVLSQLGSTLSNGAIGNDTLALNASTQLLDSMNTMGDFMVPFIVIVVFAIMIGMLVRFIRPTYDL